MTTPPGDVASRPARLAVGVVGAGRVGSVLGAALQQAGHRVVAVSAVSDPSLRRAEALLPDVPVVAPPEVLSTSSQVHAAFADIRLAAADQPYVIRTLVEVLSDLMISVRAADREGQEAAILAEARLAVDSLRHSGLPERDVEWAVSDTGVLPQPRTWQLRVNATY